MTDARGPGSGGRRRRLPALLALPIAAVAAALLAAGCSGAGGSPAPAATTTPSAPAGAAVDVPWFLAVDARGAVVLDAADGTMRGFDRARGRVWTDTREPATSVALVCDVACPDAVSSSVDDAKGLNGPPVRLTAAGRAAFRSPAAAHVRVLSVRSATDLVTEEGDAAGHSWLRVVRPGGPARIDVAARGYRWTESADGRWALAYPDRPTAGGDLLWFSHDAGGWRQRRAEPRGTFVTACLAGDGSTAVLAGDRPALLSRDGARTPAGAGLSNALDCVAGRRAIALVGRSMRGDRRVTVVSGLDARGAVRWTREVPVEAAVVAHPAAAVVGIADGRSFALVDDAGGTVWRRDHVRNATFTRDGRLVVVAPDGTVRWLPAPILPAGL
jgi:hypothetical protein